MKRRLAIIPMTCIALLSACGGDGETSVVHEAEGFTFAAPESVVAEPPAGGSGVLAGPGLRVAYDYGEKAKQPSAGKDDVRVSLLSIDGRNAYVEYFQDPGDRSGMPFVATLYIDDAGGGSRLAMVIRASEEDGHDVAKSIFRSVDFTVDPAGAG